MGDIRLITLNVRGLRDTVKRRALFRHCHAIYPGYFVCLQETHSVQGDENIWRAEWGSELFLSHGLSVNQGGVAILVPGGYSGKAKLVPSEHHERMVMLELEMSGERLFVISVYAPNSNHPRDQIRFIEELDNRLCDLPEISRIFLCGDFNMHLSPLDTSSDFVNSTAIARMSQLLDRFGLVDIWRYVNPNLSGFTWRRGETDPAQQSRIDLFFVSQSTVSSQGIHKIEVRPSYKSDHHMLVLEMNLKRYRRGPGVWRLNNSLLTNETFLRKVIEEIGCAKQEEGLYRNTRDLGLRMKCF